MKWKAYWKLASFALVLISVLSKFLQFCLSINILFKYAFPLCTYDQNSFILFGIDHGSLKATHIDAYITQWNFPVLVKLLHLIIRYSNKHIVISWSIGCLMITYEVKSLIFWWLFLLRLIFVIYHYPEVKTEKKKSIRMLK